MHFLYNTASESKMLDRNDAHCDTFLNYRLGGGGCASYKQQIDLPENYTLKQKNEKEAF